MQSYPFLAIANKYGLPYGDVLMVADHWRRGDRFDHGERSREALHNALLWPHEALGEITFANSDFRAIQAGLIDWQTGEPINRERFAKPFPMCRQCNGSGWIGHGMGGDTCGACGGTGSSQAVGRALRPLPPKPEVIDFDEPEPGEHQEVLDALDYRNREE